jgi:hypothetical protein
MAEAVQDRTERLERTAADLHAGKDELARERTASARWSTRCRPLIFFDDAGA